MLQLQYFDQYVLRSLTADRLRSLSDCENCVGGASVYGVAQPKKRMLRALSDNFGNALVCMSARAARVDAREKVAIGDVFLFDHVGQQTLGFIKFRLSVPPAEAGTIAEAMRACHQCEVHT